MSEEITRHRIPIAVIVTLALQTAAAFLWAGSVSERVAYLERQAAVAELLVERVARLEEKVIEVRAATERIERRLEAERANAR